MAYVQKPGQGSLFQNDRKDSDNHPDMKGTINIDGQEYWLSGWKKDSSNGEFISLSAKPKTTKPTANNAKPAGKQPPAGLIGENKQLNDEIPF